MATQLLQGQAGVDTEDRAHAARPGTGPAGCVCGMCAWSVWHEDRYRGRALKCNLLDWDWTARTDIRSEDVACRHFDPRSGC